MWTRLGSLMLVLSFPLAPPPATCPPCEQTSARRDDAAPVARVANTTISMGQLTARIGNRLVALDTQRYMILSRALDDMVTEAVMELEATSRGLTVERLTAVEVDTRVRPVTDEEVQAVLDNMPQPSGAVPTATADRVRTSIGKRRADARKREFIAELRRKHGVQVALEPPRVRLDGRERLVKGPSTAPVTIVEFADFECPFCARVQPVLRRLEAAYPEQIRVVFRHYPLASHTRAIPAAEAAECANEQGKFWQYHDQLFSSQKRLEAADLHRQASDIGLSMAAFTACVESRRHTKTWQDEKAAGDQSGVTGSPTFLVNGIFLSGLQLYEVFASVIEGELARRRSKPSLAQEGAPK